MEYLKILYFFNCFSINYNKLFHLVYLFLGVFHHYLKVIEEWSLLLLLIKSIKLILINNNYSLFQLTTILILY